MIIHQPYDTSFNRMIIHQQYDTSFSRMIIHQTYDTSFGRMIIHQTYDTSFSRMIIHQSYESNMLVRITCHIVPIPLSILCVVVMLKLIFRYMDTSANSEPPNSQREAKEEFWKAWLKTEYAVLHGVCARALLLCYLYTALHLVLHVHVCTNIRECATPLCSV